MLSCSVWCFNRSNTPPYCLINF